MPFRARVRAPAWEAGPGGARTAATLLVLAAACQSSGAPEAGPEQRGPQVVTPRHDAAREAPAAWGRYRPTLARAGVEEPFVVVLEVELAGATGVRVAAAHMLGGVPTVSVWRLAPTGDEGVLEVAGAPRVLGRVDGGSREDTRRVARALGRQLQAPGNRARRPSSPVGTPEELLPELGRAARALVDPRAPARARVEGLARVLAGLDLDLVLDVHGWPALVAALSRVQADPPPALRGQGRRRQTTAGGTRWTLLEGARGWKIVDLEPSSREASAPNSGAPEEASSVGSASPAGGRGL